MLMHDEVDARTRRDIYFEKSDWKKFCLSEIYGAEKILGTLAPGWILRRIRRVRALKIQRNVIRMQGGVTNCVPEFYCYRIKALKRIPADKK